MYFYGKDYCVPVDKGAKSAYWIGLIRKETPDKVKRVRHPLADMLKIKDMGGRRIRVYYPDTHRFKIGDCFYIYDVRRQYAGIFVDRSKNITFENIKQRFNYSLALVAQDSENITVDSVDFSPGESSARKLASVADFIQLCMCRGKVSVKNSYFDGAGDDCLNVHGIHFKITEKIVDNAHLVSAATASSPEVYRYDCADCDTMSEYLTFTYGDVENDVALGRPVNISAKQSATAIKLAWSPVAGATGYRIYLKIADGWKTLGDVAGTTATLNNLKPGTVYQYAVRAGAKVGGAVYLADSYTQIKTATKTYIPKIVAIKQTDSAVQFSWGRVAGATGYRVYGRTLNSKSWKNLGNTIGNVATIKKLAAGTKFAFAVRPFTIVDDNVIWSDYKEYVIATAPGKVSFAVGSPASRKIQLKWYPANGAEGYEIYYKSSNSNGYKLYKKVSASTNELTILNAKSGQKFEFAVRAYLTTPTVGVVRGGYYVKSVTVK